MSAVVPGFTLGPWRTESPTAAPNLYAACARAAEQFEAYAAQHDAKGTADGAAKAQTNREMARMCRAALARATNDGAA